MTSVTARLAFAFVDFLLAVGAGVALLAVAAMGVSEVFAGSVVAEEFLFNAFPDGCVLAGYHFHVAELTGPSGSTDALVDVLPLDAGGAVLARRLGTPIYVVHALLSGVAVRTVTGVVVVVIVTSSTVSAGLRVAFVDLVLTVRSSESGLA